MVHCAGARASAGACMRGAHPAFISTVDGITRTTLVCRAGRCILMSSKRRRMRCSSFHSCRTGYSQRELGAPAGKWGKG